MTPSSKLAKLLLAEDDEMSADMLKRRLERRGYMVLRVSDGEACVHLAETEQPDLVLMDSTLPVLDGHAATQVIKANSGTAHIPVVMLSARAFTQDQERAAECGAAAFATKPVHFSRLVAEIERLLPADRRGLG